MFDHTSRYHQVADSFAELAAALSARASSPNSLLEPSAGELEHEIDGRKVLYKKRRFLPQPENTGPILVELTVEQGDRLDLVAGRTIGRPEAFWRICDASGAMNPFDLLATGRLLRVPVPQA